MRDLMNEEATADSSRGLLLVALDVTVLNVGYVARASFFRRALEPCVNHRADGKKKFL